MQEPIRTAAIALGANLGDRAATIARAVDRISNLEHSTLTAVSTNLETDPIGVLDQPRFLNACCTIETALDPHVLLATFHEIERDLGRDRIRERRWGPRAIDLDLVLLADLILDEPALTIPHPRMHERGFVLEPLAQIAPDLVHPGLGISVAQLLDRLRAGSATPQSANLWV